ncbi:uncharacterized protein LOC117784526 isoform X2 [Drosophila innubila]|uniref:uncharacterized protein LOC117784526 isoform X2 n=1 Tax=Drosophila innubila TaxID=198719 RepID=UPI00148C880C|nr:uncharacterized protein LOC117784526 isoform X2 [Drosophila innubila]
MSIRKYKNPVNNHFIYNDDIRKSTCKICYFDMAGRHSENLMRHLMRKHPATYAEVMIEKQRRRTANLNQSGSTTDTTSSPLSSMFKFETEPHKFLIKSVTNSDTFSNEYEDEDEDQTGNGQFESVYLAKAELRDGQMNDSNESLSYQESHPEDSEFIISNLPPQNSATAETHVATATVANAVATSNATSSGSSTIATIASPNPDDAFFLQYLGNKFGKYSANTKNTVQFHINRILYKADMGCYDNADASKVSETDI